MTQTLAPCDGVALARIVRAVAAQARRTLSGPADPAESLDLMRAIDSLEGELLLRPSGDLSRWLSSLRRRIEDHLAPALAD